MASQGDAVPSVDATIAEGAIDKTDVPVEERKANTDAPAVPAALERGGTAVSLAPANRGEKKKATRAFMLEDKDFEGAHGDLLKEMDLDGDGRITFNEIVESITLRSKAEIKNMKMRRIVFALFVVVVFVVALNSVSTIITIERTKESFVANQNLIDRNNQKVRVASSEMGVKLDGQICPLSETGECLSNVVKTGEARSFASLFDLPAFDSKTLASVREMTLLLQGGHELTLTISGCMKHKGGKAATFYSGSGRVAVDATSMTAVAVVEGQQHVVTNTKQRLRRLQEGPWQPQLYEERDFFTAENGFDVVLDAQTGRPLRRRLAANSAQSGWASLALAIGEAVAGHFEGSTGNQIQSFASISGILTVTSQGAVTNVDMAILYNKTRPEHSRLRLATGGQAWLTEYGQSMEFAYSNGVLQSCEVLSGPTAPAVIQSAVTLVEEDGMVTAFSDSDVDVALTMAITSVHFDTVTAPLQVPAASECSAIASGRRLEALPEPVPEALPENGTGALSGRRLGAMSMNSGWRIIQQTYDASTWSSAWGDQQYHPQALPSDWTFEPGQCKFGSLIAKVATRKTDSAQAISFIATASMHDLVRRAANRDSAVAGEVQFMIGSFPADMGECIKKKLQGRKSAADTPYYVLGHGLGGGAAVNFYHRKASSTLANTDHILTFGAPPTGPGRCDLDNAAHYAHVNDAVSSELFSTGSDKHEAADGKVYDDTSPRRRWKTWERRRRSQWEWTDDCERYTSGSFSNVDAVLSFSTGYSSWTR